MKRGVAKKSIPEIIAAIGEGDFGWEADPSVEKGNKDTLRELRRLSEKLSQQAELNRLSLSEDLQNIFSYTSDFICIGKQGSLSRISPSFIQLLNCSEAEILSRPLTEFIHPEDRQLTDKAMASLIEGASLVNFENRYVTGNGGYRRISWICKSIGNLETFYLMGRDVTALREAENRNKEVLRALNESAIVAYTDVAGRITAVNENFCKISGYNADELIGKTHAIINSNSHSKEFFREMWSTILSGKTWTGDIENRSKDGNHYHVRTVIVPIKNSDGSVVEFMAIRFDISQQMQAEKQLKQAQSIAKIGTWVYEIPTKKLTWSDEVYNIFELPHSEPQETLFDKFFQCVYPDDQKRIESAIAGAMQGNDFSLIHRLVTHGGKTMKPVRGTGKVIKDKDGNPFLISGTCLDVTELVTLQEQTQYVLSSMGIGIWKYDLAKDQVHWDESMYSLYGRNKAESSPTQIWQEALGKETSDSLLADLRSSDAWNKEFSRTLEVTVRDQQKRCLGFRAIRQQENAGRSSLVYGINWDRTKEIEDERQLRQKQKLLHSVLYHIPNMVFVKEHDNGLRFSLFNKFGQDMVGASEENIIGKNDFDFFSKEQAEFFMQKDLEVFKRGELVRIEKEPIDTVKGKRWLRTYKVPTYKPDGSPDLLIGIATDITEELVLQERLENERVKSVQAAKLASLGEMSAGIAHEINNPLAIISGNIQLLKTFRDDAEKFDAKIGVMKKATQRIEKIVNGLRKFARVSTSTEYKLEKVSELIQESINLTEPKSKRYNVPIEVNIDTESRVLCDGVEIEQVIINLINNAIDAVEGNAEKWVRIKAFNEHGETVIQVIDSGKGISKEVENKLFQPFYTTKPVGRGTGLGLSIAKGIIEQHKAQLVLNSKMPNTCFEIRFPGAEVSRAA